MLLASVKSLVLAALYLQVQNGQAAQPFRTSLTLKDFREQVNAASHSSRHGNH